MTEIALPLIILFIMTGVVTGALSAIFGFGGGIIMVPVLYEYLSYLNLDSTMTMHVAIATSLLTMLVITTNTIYAHHKRGDIVLPVVKRMIPWISIGAFVGSIIAASLESALLHNLFVAFLVIAILLQIMRHDFVESHELKDFVKPSFGHNALTCTLIGFIAVLIGVGGSVMTVPFLRQAKMPIVNAASIAVSLVPAVSIFGTLGYFIVSFYVPVSLNYNIGYIYLPAFVLISLGTLVGVPMGVRLSHVISDKVLAVTFVILLCGLLFAMMF